MCAILHNSQTGSTKVKWVSTFENPSLFSALGSALAAHSRSTLPWHVEVYQTNNTRGWQWLAATSASDSFWHLLIWLHPTTLYYHLLPSTTIYYHLLPVTSATSHKVLTMHTLTSRGALDIRRLKCRRATKTRWTSESCRPCSCQFPCPETSCIGLRPFRLSWVHWATFAGRNALHQWGELRQS